MSPNDRRLRRHLIIAVVVKLVVLMLLWWFFIKDSRVSVDADQAAQRLGVTPSHQGAPP